VKGCKIIGQEGKGQRVNCGTSAGDASTIEEHEDSYSRHQLAAISVEVDPAS
jgi:hypothetical protein